MTAPMHEITPEDFHALSMAYETLEHPSYAARLSSLLGVPLEKAVELMPRRLRNSLQNAANSAIAQATEVAISSLGDLQTRPPQRGVHRLLAVGSGAVGGYFGLPGLTVELPVITVLMLRSIADIARSQGEDLASPETQMECVSVFALGGRSHDDDYAEIGYYEVRSALALHFSSALERVIGRSGKAETLPATVDIIRIIASRFGLAVSDKAAAQLVPVVGAISGALVNALFMQHFQVVAHGHFTLRRLERRYGKTTIEAAYAAMTRDKETPPSGVKPRRPQAS
jgi:hypothetical protein